MRQFYMVRRNDDVDFALPCNDCMYACKMRPKADSIQIGTLRQHHSIKAQCTEVRVSRVLARSARTPVRVRYYNRKSAVGPGRRDMCTISRGTAL